MDTSKTKSAHLTLEAGCTLRDAIDMQFILLAADTTDEQIVVDGGMVEHVDTAGLQLLVAFARRQRAAGHAVHWVRVSDVLRTASARLGLDAELALGSAPKGNAT